MSSVAPAQACLNCAAELRGEFSIASIGLSLLASFDIFITVVR
jgi:hypothetical protein